MSVAELERLEELRTLVIADESGRDPWRPHPYQVAPPQPWHTWLMLGGRGSGKTDGCAYYFDRFMRRNPDARGAIIGPTLGDAVEACINGPSGLKAHNPTVVMTGGAGGLHVFWPNGSEAKVFGASSPDDVERLRAGGNRHIAWCEELAAWRYLEECWDHMEFGLRLGEHPRVIALTTPKPRKHLRQLIDDPRTAVTRARTIDNAAHLPAEQVAALVAKYAGTRLGRQELDGELIEDQEGALWTSEMIDALRVAKAPDLARVVVALDPSGGDEDGNDEQGIVVAGLGVDGHAYVVADRSCKLSPGGWGKRSVQAWVDLKADRIVCEANYGGDMVESTIRTAASAMGQEGVRVVKVSASRGKMLRAEPIAALYEQGRVHHVGEYDSLEYQQTHWTPESGWSPDRMDALVWALTDLMLPKHSSWGLL